jgi:hypothetical protein
MYKWFTFGGILIFLPVDIGIKKLGSQAVGPVGSPEVARRALAAAVDDYMGAGGIRTAIIVTTTRTTATTAIQRWSITIEGSVSVGRIAGTAIR